LASSRIILANIVASCGLLWVGNSEVKQES
jgi:hypothetical protein